MYADHVPKLAKHAQQVIMENAILAMHLTSLKMDGADHIAVKVNILMQKQEHVIHAETIAEYVKMIRDVLNAEMDIPI